MFIVYTFLYILLITVNFIDAQSCKTPKDEIGRCVSLYDCKPLLDMITDKNRTESDNAFLESSECGYGNDISMVCCPIANECVTPDNKIGKCVGLYNCQHITYMLLDSITNDFVNKSICNGLEKHSVCCGPPPETNPLNTSANGKCFKANTAFPPKIDSKCCGVQSVTGNKIIGGVDAKIDEYPWLVVIEYIKLGETMLLCGGSLISTKYVLTAGHCVTGSILNYGTPKNVRLGEYNTTNNGPDCVMVEGGGVDCTHPVVIAPIEKTIPHPDYKPFHLQRRHDIALIRLTITAPYTDFVRPICLPTIDYTVQPPADFELFVAGWGRYKQFENGTRLSSKVKQHVMVPYVARDQCQVSIRTVREGAQLVINNGQLCAGGEAGKDSCKGDSGGPLMYKMDKTFVAVGVVSFGAERCGTENVPGIYTNVYEYLPWIKSTIEA